MVRQRFLETEKNFTIAKTGTTTFDLTSSKYRYVIGGFPRGILAPIGMNPNAYITKLSITTKSSIVMSVDFTTNEQDEFKYHFKYSSANALQSANITYRAKSQSVWQTDSNLNYSKCD